jgi:hypothetical protein
MNKKQLINGEYYPNAAGYTPSQAYFDKKKEIKEQEQKLKAGKFVENEFLNNYKNTINTVREKLACLYGKCLYIADNEAGNLFQKIKTIMEQTQTTITQMIKDLIYVLGYKFNLNRFENGKMVIIQPNIIQKAWELRNTKNLIQIENVLFF